MIVLGKGSGRASIEHKLKELGISLDLSMIPELLSEVKQLSIKMNASVSDSLFIEMARSKASSLRGVGESAAAHEASQAHSGHDSPGWGAVSGL
jgi:isopropylmalate/homocitrate/citramalate synthase